MTDPERVARKSVEKIAEYGFSVPLHLPTLESPADLAPQGASKVAERAVILTYIVGVGFGAPVARLRDAVARFDLDAALSGRETSLLNGTISDQDRVDCTWLTECLQAIAWALGLADLEPDQHGAEQVHDRIANTETRELRYRMALPHSNTAGA